MREILPGCEDYEYLHEQAMSAYPDNYFRVGDRSNRKNFEYITPIVDSWTIGDWYVPREHPSVSSGICKGEKLKCLGLKFAYGIRFETDKGDVSFADAIGNVFIHTIKKRFIITNDGADNLKSIMFEQTFYIDKFGNKWRLLNEEGDVILVEVSPENFNIGDYINKPDTDYINEFSFSDYEYWKCLNGTIKPLY